MIEITGLPDEPLPFLVTALIGGFAAVAAVKLVFALFAPARPFLRAGEAMDAIRAEVVDWTDGAGYVEAGGELWRAISKAALAPGDEVRIKSVNGLTLQVMKIKA